MEVYHDTTGKFDRLRWQAEELIRHRANPDAAPTADMLELIHELKIHQAELQIQNEELKRAQQELSELHREYERLYEFAPCGYITLDARGLITHVNLTGVKLLGTHRNHLLHSGLILYIAEGWQDVFQAARKTAGETSENQSVELRLRQGNRHGPWIWMQIQAQRDEAGGVNQWRMTLSDISLKKEAETALLNSERKYRALFSIMVSGAAVLEIAERDRKGHITDLRFVEVNKAFEKMTGFSYSKVEGRCIREIWPKTESFWFHQADRAMRDGQSMQIEGFHEELGKHFLLSAFVLDDKLIGVTFVDISAQIKIKETLDRARKELATQVDRRTAELRKSNQQLRRAIVAHERTQAELLDQSRELEDRQVSLEEANTALKVLLESYRNERRVLEEKMICNLNKITRPHLDRLAASDLSRRQRTFLDAVNASLDDIASPLNRFFMMDSIRLTPTESRVAGLIRQCKSTKEIAEIMGVATSTIDFHRHNIRRKLKLSRNTNLQSYLNSLE